MTTIELGKTYESESKTFREAWNNGRIAAEQAHNSANTMVRILKQENNDWTLHKILSKIAADHTDLDGFSIQNLYKYLDKENSKMLQTNHFSHEKQNNSKKDPPPEPPEEEPTPLELAEIRIQQLEDALKKTEQFKPATQLESKPITKLDDDTVFQYLRDRAKETGSILIIDRVGSGALIQALAQYKNSFKVAELFLRVIQ